MIKINYLIKKINKIIYFKDIINIILIEIIYEKIFFKIIPNFILFYREEKLHHYKTCYFLFCFIFYAFEV